MIDFEKFFMYLKEKLEEVSFDDPQSDTAKGFNTGADTMYSYALCALMMAQGEYTREKVNA